MKVLYFHQYFVTPDYTVGTRSYEFSRELIERGHSVTMVCGATNSDHFDLPEYRNGIWRGKVDGIEVIALDIPYSNYMGFAERTRSFLTFAVKCMQIAVQEEYDLLFATSTPLTACLPGIFIKLLGKKIPFVFEVRDLWPELPKAMGVIKNSLVLKAMSALEWSGYRAADACIGLSPGIVAGIKNKSRVGKKVAMIANGCDLELFHPHNKTESFLPGIDKNDFVAVFTGAHGIANGLHAVLDCANVLKNKKRGRIKLVFIGDGKKKQELVARAKKEQLGNCLFFNPMPKKKLAKIMSNMDAGLMILDNVPAFYYGTSPNKFFDYISCGLPVINNYPGWLAEIIEREQCGIAVEPENPSAFADALCLLADDKKLCSEMGKQSRKLAETQFSRKDLAKQFILFLEQF